MHRIYTMHTRYMWIDRTCALCSRATAAGPITGIKILFKVPLYTHWRFLVGLLLGKFFC